MDFSKMGEMMEQAAAMKEQMEAQQEATVVEGQSGGGLVTVTMNGRKEMLKLRIEPTVLGSSAKDLELLEDLIVAAVNAAGRKADEASQAGMAGLMGGMGLPGLG